MAVSKITTPPSQKEVIDKINEIVDDKVSNTDYASSSTGGVIKTSNSIGTGISSGTLYAVTKTYADYQTASNYLFVSKATLDNVLTGKGYITGITSSDVTTALGYTPYNSSNPNGYTSVIESTVSGWGFTKNEGTVTSVNNTSPVNGNVTLSIPTQASDIGAQEALISGTNIKTINGSSILGSGNVVVTSNNLFDFKWSDHLLNDQSWLQSNGSWQNGTTYSNAYNHLVDDIDGITAETETVGNYTITFYRASDGHKICLADQETTAEVIYSEFGIAWYYILDTTNTRFKFPRTMWGFEGIKNGNVGDKIDETLPNITGDFTVCSAYNPPSASGAFEVGVFGYPLKFTTGDAAYRGNYGFSASRSSSVYQTNASVQEKATQMYLYFYVGEFSQTATEQTAGLNSELFNGKADVDLSNLSNGLSNTICTTAATTTSSASSSTPAVVVENYVNGKSWYRVYSDGWCEQGGQLDVAINSWGYVTFLIEMANTDYNIGLATNTTSANYADSFPCYWDLQTTKMQLGARYLSASAPAMIRWSVSGYKA